MTATPPRPAGYHTLTPGLFVDDGVAALDFYERGFGAEGVRKAVLDGKVLIAELRIGESMFQVSDALPGLGVAPPDPARGDAAAILVWTEDVDGMHARAVASGAEVINRPETRFHGFRSGAVRDPFGHRWAFVRHAVDVPAEDFMDQAGTALAAASARADGDPVP